MDPAATLLMPGCVVASARGAVPAAVRNDSNARAVFDQFVDLLYRRRQVRAAFESCVVAQGFRDHAPGGFGGRAQAMERLAATLGSDGVAVQLLHVVFDGDIGMVHLAATPPDPQRTATRVEIFRVQAGRIVEHWSVAG